ncbi:MAG: integrase arm-type DNA-binding domain-containing protein [Xanthomonadales bacterium]|nr:integrase arm-type DNA-binding domain-containing protein [Xanthomonadales bacterium]
MGKLTDLAIRNAKPRARKYKLSGGRGLTLIVMPDGAKYWRLRYSYAGKEQEISLGRPYPALTLREAEAEATRMRDLVATGIDPREERLQQKIDRNAKAASSFSGAAEAWYEFRSKAWARSTANQVREYLDKDLLPALGKRPLSAISTKELANLTRQLEQRGAPDVAKKARQWLASIFSYARANGWVETDPVRDLRALVLPASSGTNYPHLTLDELPLLLRKLDAFDASPLVKGAAKLSLWTANRPGVTRTVRWDEIDLDGALWTIAKGREGMKRGYAHLTPLPRQAVTMLREIHSLTGTFEHVFIGRNDPLKPLSDGAVNMLLKRLGYRGKQTAHGFRHLISTALNELGYESDWVERQLAHGDPDKIRGTYNKAQYLEHRRKMMQDWADFLDRLRTRV